MKKIKFKGQKLTNIKKKGLFGPKKQAGAELKEKKRIFWPKIGEKFENKVKKLSNFKEKGLFWPKKQAGAELKKGFVGQKLRKHLTIRF